MPRWPVLTALLLALAPTARAASVPFAFQASLSAGPLAGTTFSGTGSYDDAPETGIGTDYLPLTALDFSLLGTQFTRAGIDQGGQAILQNGTLQYFTAAYFPESQSAPVSDIAFGFGGPSTIGYVDQQAFGAGTYAFVPVPVPEPAALLALAPALLLLLRARASRPA